MTEVIKDDPEQPDNVEIKKPSAQFSLFLGQEEINAEIAVR